MNFPYLSARTGFNVACFTSANFGGVRTAGFRGGFVRPGFRHGFVGNRFVGHRFARFHNRRFIGPVFVGAGFYPWYAYGYGYDDTCWVPRWTAWGWCNVYVCGYY